MIKDLKHMTKEQYDYLCGIGMLYEYHPEATGNYEADCVNEVSWDILQGMIFAIDFDGTCVTHEYPKVGRFIGAEKVLSKLSQAGVKLILWTMRSGDTLDAAVEWFKDRNIPLYGVNNNPTQSNWTSSPKVYAQVYVDDAALGIPLCFGLFKERPYVDWDGVEKMMDDLCTKTQLANVTR